MTELLHETYLPPVGKKIDCCHGWQARSLLLMAQKYTLHMSNTVYHCATDSNNLIISHMSNTVLQAVITI